MKAIVYYRMSSDQQTDSIERQRSEVEPVVEREGDEIVAVYIDKGKSGSKHRSKRRDFLRMMRDIERGIEAKKLYLWDLARFTRENPFKAAEFYALLMDRDILIHDVKMGVIDLNTPQGRMIVNMMQETNHAYSTTISENTTSGRRRLLAQGWWVAGSIPYGYMRRYVGPSGEEKILPRNHNGFQKPRGWHLALSRNDEEAELVEAMFEMYLKEDTSIRAIARWLNEQGIVPPSGDAAKGWKNGTVVNIIDNRAYCGYSHIGGSHRRYRDNEVFGRIGDDEVKSDKVPELIPEGKWERAQAKRRKRREQRANPKPTQHGMLSGILYCGHCRYALDKVERSDKERHPYVYYTCQTGARYPAKCDCHQWRVIENDILPLVMHKLFDAVETRLEEMAVQREEKAADADRSARLRSKLTEVDAAVSRANQRFLRASDSLSDDQMDQMRADLQELLGSLEAEKSETEKQLYELELSEASKSAMLGEFREMKRMLMLEYTEDHPVVQALFGERIRRRRQRNEELGLADVTTTTLVLPVSPTDRLRAFLKELGARVYIYWRPRALQDKRGNIRRDKSGEVVRSNRNFEVDAVRVHGEFDAQKVLTNGSSRSNHANSHGRDSG